jgi:hypothetical protein
LPNVAAGQPVFTKRIYIGSGRFNLLLTRLQQLKWPKLHCVILKLRLVDDPLSQREKDISIVQSPISRPL